MRKLNNMDKKNKKAQKSSCLLSKKSGQDMKSKISSASPFGKKAQEEMVGFALILIIVAVIFIVLLASYIKKPQSEGIGSSEANSFVQSFLQYTTSCEQNSENITVQRLIFKCQEKEICSYNLDPCKVLNDTLKGIIKESWNVGEKNPVKGYSLIIFSEKQQILNLSEGVVTNNYKGSEQDFGKGDEFIIILFNAYS